MKSISFPSIVRRPGPRAQHPANVAPARWQARGSLRWAPCRPPRALARPVASRLARSRRLPRPNRAPLLALGVRAGAQHLWSIAARARRIPKAEWSPPAPPSRRGSSSRQSGGAISASKGIAILFTPRNPRHRPASARASRYMEGACDNSSPPGTARAAHAARARHSRSREPDRTARALAPAMLGSA